MLVSRDNCTILVLIAASCAAGGTAGGLWRSFSKMVLNHLCLLAVNFTFFGGKSGRKELIHISCSLGMGITLMKLSSRCGKIILQSLKFRILSDIYQ